MERISKEQAKQAILKKHCSPETTERDITITDVEETLLGEQLTADRAELEKVVKILRQCHDFLDRHNAEYATAKELCLVCHSNRWNGIGITHEDWCPIQQARGIMTKYIPAQEENDGR